MAAVHGVGGDGLAAGGAVPGAGKVRDDKPVAAGGNFGPANIAEGAQRNRTGEFLQFLGIASGSLAETETFLLLAERLGLLPPDRTNTALEQADNVGRMLTGHKRSLQARRDSGA